MLAAEPAWTQPNSRELAIFPFTPKLNTFTSTQQYGFAGRLLFPFHERLSLMVTGKFAYGALDRDGSDFANEALRFEPTPARSQLLTGAAFAGFEGKPFIGRIWAFDAGPVEIGLVLNGGFGVAFTRIEAIQGQADVGLPPSYFDTGWRFAGQVGGGLRVKLHDWVTFRLELQNVIMGAETTSVNGCNNDDLVAMDRALRAGAALETVPVSTGCNRGRFEGRDETTGRLRADSVPIALSLVRVPSAGVQHLLELYLGLGIAF